MRDPNRIPRILGKIQRVWEQNPDLRLGQLIQNLVDRNQTKGVFYYEDDALEQALDRPGAQQLKS